MKEQIAFGVFTALLERDNRKPKDYKTGAMVLMGVLAAIGFALFFVDGYFIKYPLYIIITPMTWLLVLAITNSLSIGSFYAIALGFMAMPSWAAFTAWCIDLPVSYFVFDIDHTSLSDRYYYLLNSAFGGFSEHFDYWGITNALFGSKSTPLVCLSMFILVGNIAFLFVFPYILADFIVGEIDNATDNYFDEQYEKEQGKIAIGFGGLVTALFYWITFPYFELFEDLPFGLSYLATWLLMLTPPLGLGLCEVNRRRRSIYRVGNSIIYLFMLSITLMCAAYFMVNVNEFNHHLNEAIRGNYQSMYYIAYPLTLLLIPYMFLNRKKEYSKQQAA